MTNLISATLVYDGSGEPHLPVQLLPDENPKEQGIFATQFKGTPLEKLCEVAGRSCYSSFGKGRDSADFHKHILDVGHLSVIEHATMTVDISDRDREYVPYIALMFMNRPNIWISQQSPYGIRITINLRHVLEWDTFNPQMAMDQDVLRATGAALQELARTLAPQIVATRNLDHDIRRSEWEGTKISIPGTDAIIRLVEPNVEEQQWVSLFLTGSRGMCYDSDTDVLTDEGWKRWPDVRGDERFCTLNPHTDAVEYQEATAVVHERYCGAMYKLRSKFISLMVTPNHRMLVQKHDTRAARRHEEPWGVLTAAEVVGKRVHYRRSGGTWAGSGEGYIHIPAVGVSLDSSNQFGAFTGVRTSNGLRIASKLFAKFMGYWLAEGSNYHCKGGSYAVCLTQNEGTETFHDIISTLHEMGFTPNVTKNGHHGNMRIRISSHALYEYLKPQGTQLTRFIPDEIKGLDTECLEALIRAHHAGDGGVPARSILGETNTISKKLADDLQEIAMKIGWSATIREVDRRTNAPRSDRYGNVYKHNHLAYVVGFCSPNYSRPLVNHGGKKHDQWVEYDGTVHCVTVPNGLLYVRRDGRPVWSGNSHEQVRHGDWTAISQRSTRFVDESESPWVMHPLERAYRDERYAPLKEEAQQTMAMDHASGSVSLGKAKYKALVAELEPWLIARGVDKTTARKQARGAARGYLGNALYTELLFSASVTQWKRMLRQRASQFADAEIRQVYASEAMCVLGELKKSRYASAFAGWDMSPAPDGIGHVLVVAESAAAKA